MANKLKTRTNPQAPAQFDALGDESVPRRPLAEDHGLVGDVVFEPPLTAEERRRRGVGIPLAERLEQARRQLAAGKDRP